MMAMTAFIWCKGIVRQNSDIPLMAKLSEASWLGCSGRVFIEISKNFTGRYIARSAKKYGMYPGGETLLTPDDPDVLDGGDGVEVNWV
jgi:hypothetical protein